MTSSSWCRDGLNHEIGCFNGDLAFGSLFAGHKLTIAFIISSGSSFRHQVVGFWWRIMTEKTEGKNHTFTPPKTNMTQENSNHESMYLLLNFWWFSSDRHVAKFSHEFRTPKSWLIQVIFWMELQVGELWSILVNSHQLCRTMDHAWVDVFPTEHGEFPLEISLTLIYTPWAILWGFQFWTTKLGRKFDHRFQGNHFLNQCKVNLATRWELVATSKRWVFLQEANYESSL